MRVEHSVSWEPLSRRVINLVNVLTVFEEQQPRFCDENEQHLLTGGLSAGRQKSSRKSHFLRGSKWGGEICSGMTGKFPKQSLFAKANMNS